MSNIPNLVTNEILLRQKSESIDLEGGLALANKLRDYLDKCEIGVGLSAPQISEFYRVAVVSTSEGYLYLINPEVLDKQEPYIFRNEGCLSFPGLWLDTIRYNYLKIKDDLHGESEFHNFGSAVVQHECEHHEGVLFFDNKVPKGHEKCFCGSGKKFKSCHMKYI